MFRSTEQMLRDARKIWQAGVDAVRSDRLVEQALRVEGDLLVVDEQETIDLSRIEHIEVVGAGKAGAGMAAGVLAALGPELKVAKRLTGWVNVPADCVGNETGPIHLHPARPAGVNEPTAAGVVGAEEILRRVAALGPRDLCVALISGGGSALLPAPIEGISLDDKLAVTRLLSAGGATINQLNSIRKPLSRIKGGGLARACRAGKLMVLIISDVLGDPLDVIASGPTVPSQSTAADALAILQEFALSRADVPESVWQALEAVANRSAKRAFADVHNFVIGNNAVAVDAAGLMAESLGYSHAMTSARESEGLADDVGRHLADMALRMRATAGPDCLISGGEPVVKLVASEQRGRGGRNQQLVLAALARLVEADAGQGRAGRGIVILSGGTDGEDGPTDAAGAVLCGDSWPRARDLGLDLATFLGRNDAFTFWDRVGSLIRTGPTHTNVCDLRVVLVDRIELIQRTA